MSITDELRRLLDGRGVEWMPSVWSARDETFYKVGNTGFLATEMSGGRMRVCIEGYVAPEQAVDATLGRGTCRFIYEDNYNETEGCDAYSWFRCSACGWTFDECDRWLTTMSYCPNCGRRIEVDA